MSENNLHEEIIQAFFKMHKVFKNGMSFDSKIAHLSPVQIHTLFFLENKKIPVGDIARYFTIAIPTVTALLDKLVEMKLVSRKQSKEDRRMVYVSLTKPGDNLLKKAKIQRAKKINEILSKLSQEDKEQLLSILKKVTDK